MKKNISVIIPCFNEEAVIEKCYISIKTALDTSDFHYRILFINDGSTDRTTEILYSIAQTDKNVTVINFSRNFGHQAAVTAGIHHCNSDFAVIIDADLQDPPELIPQMLACREKEDANVVYCVRKSREGESKFKFWAAKRFYRIFNQISKENFPLDAGDFRLIDNRIIQEFKRFKERGKYVRGLISWVGFKQIPFYYERKPRLGGKSKYPIKKMLSFASIALFYFTGRPLQIATSLGFSAVMIGIVMGIWFVFGKLSGYTDATSGWTSLMIAILFFGGVQLLTIGVLGKYIAILFDEVKERPEYIISDIINKE